MEAGTTTTTTTTKVNKTSDMKSYKKDWRDVHNETIKLYQKEYLQNNNPIVVCDICNVKHKKYNKQVHIYSKGHQNQMTLNRLQNTINLLVQSTITTI